MCSRLSNFKHHVFVKYPHFNATGSNTDLIFKSVDEIPPMKAFLGVLFSGTVHVCFLALQREDFSWIVTLRVKKLRLMLE